MIAVACRYAPSPDLAYDIVQQAFVDYVQYALRGNYDPERDVTPLLYQITKIRAKKYWKERSQGGSDVMQQIAEQLADEPDQENLEQENDELRFLRHCLNKLSSQSRELVEQHYYQGMSFETIAKQTQKKSGTVRQACTIIRRKLRECIESMLKANR